jgi:regulatory helix-turn-helix LysR family protein
MTHVTLRQLRYFNALARHGHFGRAAEACAISQPALSMRIKELEEALGGVLLERNARQVALTRFGRFETADGGTGLLGDTVFGDHGGVELEAEPGSWRDSHHAILDGRTVDPYPLPDRVALWVGEAFDAGAVADGGD